MPDANKASPEATGQAPGASEKMEPGMDSVGGPKTAPGEEKKAEQRGQRGPAEGSTPVLGTFGPGILLVWYDGVTA